MDTKVLFSVFKRDFVGHLSNPTGYVFICVFVLLSSIAAFLTDEFFNANLANLDQLNLWFPLIMLVFVPAITMGIWADERRQGTDELLLTIPASDFDIVLGKFKAGVCIYTVSLLFSMLCNFATLRYLGEPDVGLFVSTYIGYWLIGVTMISIGMVASFLTANLTVAYILGAIFCAPLIALQWVDAAPIPAETARILKTFSIASQFEPFGRGIFTFSSLLYFAMITSTMLYLSMVLIGRRHWTANQKFIGAFHYTVRTASLLAIGLALCFFFRFHDFRADMTEERLSSLSPATTRLLKELNPEYPVVIEAFLSPDVPESHVQTRLDIISVLGEIESICGKKVSVRIHGDIRPNTEKALLADQRFGIKPQEVTFASRGRRELKSLFLGVSFRCGLTTLSLPFIDRGLSVEYELIHALCGVTTPQKKRIGVVKTDASLFGRLDMNTFQMAPQWQIIDELQRQYTVVEVDPAEPIKERYDALLAVQPSAMGPDELVNFIDAVKNGQPTVIFEDPLPVYVRSVSGTAEPRVPPSQMMMMMGRQNPKGVIDPLWSFLGASIDGNQAVWQEYSPLRKLSQLPRGFVFLDRSAEQKGSAGKQLSPFSADDPATEALQYLMMPFPGRVTILPEDLRTPTNAHAEPFTVTPILQTFQNPAGVVGIRDAIRGINSGNWDQLITEDEPQSLAVRIRGEVPPPTAVELTEGETPVRLEETRIDVLLVSDIDMLSDMLFTLRRMGNEPGSGINLNFDNVTFVLNAIDSVAGDDRFLAIRTRRPKHRTLARFDENTDEIRSRTFETRRTLQKQFEEQSEAAKEKLNREISELEQKFKQNAMSEAEVAQKVYVQLMAAQKQIQAAEERQERDLNMQLAKADVELNEYIRRVQGQYKLRAIAFPPIPPLLIGLAVFCVRKIREKEGIPQSRRRK